MLPQEGGGFEQQDEISCIFSNEELSTSATTGIFLTNESGSLPFGEQYDFDVQSLFEDHVDTPHGCFNTGRVTIIKDRNVFLYNAE